MRCDAEAFGFGRQTITCRLSTAQVQAKHSRILALEIVHNVLTRCISERPDLPHPKIRVVKAAKVGVAGCLGRPYVRVETASPGRRDRSLLSMAKQSKAPPLVAAAEQCGGCICGIN